jgi:hypothetical protein
MIVLAHDCMLCVDGVVRGTVRPLLLDPLTTPINRSLGDSLGEESSVFIIPPLGYVVNTFVVINLQRTLPTSAFLSVFGIE